MIYSAFIYRLMTQKLPKENLRPGIFVSVGPCGFTVAGIINMASNLDRAVSPDFMGKGQGQMVAFVIRVLSNWVGLWLWGMALWFFLISVGSHWSLLTHGNRMSFAMTWFSFVFPNTALVTATFAVGEAFSSKPIQILGCVMTVALVAMWIFVVVCMVRAVVKKDVLWPQKGEDRNEGGFRVEERAKTVAERRRSKIASEGGGAR